MQEKIKTTVLKESAVAGLWARMRGELIRPGDESYDAARCPAGDCGPGDSFLKTLRQIVNLPEAPRTLSQP
jgi:hypothetical protein